MPAQAIPASQVVSVVPSVLGAGGSALDMLGLILTANNRVPIGAVLSFPDQAGVARFFGSTSQEATLAAIYFLGFDGSTVKPGALLFAQYPAAPVFAWLRSGNVSSLTLAQLQALSGSLIVTIDGVVKTAAAINLAAATSFSAAAALIQTGLAITGTVGATVTASIATTVLTVTAMTTGTLAAGQILSGGTVTAGTTIVAQLTSTEPDGSLGLRGTYTVSASQTVVSAALTATNPAVSYDSLSGSFVVASGTAGAASTIGYATGTLATALMLTQAAGATISQGAIAGVPATNMDRIVALNSDWAQFMTAWEPLTADKVAFAAWTNAQSNQYGFVNWTTNLAPTTGTDTTSSGYLIQQAGYSGTVLVYANNPIGDIAAFVLGYGASLDFAATNGRATAKFRRQSGLAADVIDGTISKNLEANGYNFFGDYTTRNDAFVFFANGMVTGPFKWLDSYLNQIWLNNALQLALMSLLVEVKSVPYNQVGYTLIRAACRDPIDAGMNFGAIRAGVPLSAAQAAEVNFAAGVKIDDVLQNRGWFLQVKDATAQVRAARGTPPMSLWYMDGQSVQKVVLASVEVM
jgi:hypothetical protein